MSSFTGFPAEGIQFFSDITENNNREWFQANKHIYTNAVVEPAKAFIVELGEKLQTIAPGVQYDTRTNGSGSMMRIYRDVRFSKDKTPYKNWLGIIFWEGKGKKNQNPGFYFGISPDGVGIHAGLHGFESSVMKAYRAAADDEKTGIELAQILADLESSGYSYSGEQYKRVPRGYDKEHPREALLRYKGLITSGPRIDSAIVSSPELVDVCFAHCQKMAPLQQWLARVKKTVDSA